MLRITELRLPLEHDDAALRAALLGRLRIDDAQLRAFTVFRRAVDARKRGAPPTLIYTIDCVVGADADEEARVLAAHAGDTRVRIAPDMTYRPADVAPADYAVTGAPPRPVVIGFGPCGLFAALILAQAGWRPIVLERGTAVRERTKDTWGLWRQGVLHPESNVQFGEGGAGTFSDGKLYSQISDARHLTRKVRAEFVAAGAPDEILTASKPHIGTFRLVSMIEKMRAQIEALGGDIRFRHRVVDVSIVDGVLRGLTVARRDGDGGDGHGGGASEQIERIEYIETRAVVLAPGHSARDTFAMLYDRGVRMEAKPFAIGLRIEHPQGVIDRARWGAHAGHPLLGAADYKLVHHAANGRDVYSFCMCPGGTVVAATSEAGHVVTNGMSQYSRAERNANAGIVVGLAPADYAVADHVDTQHGGAVHPLDGIAFQRQWERRAFELGGGDYRAPGQQVGDFLRGQPSSGFGNVLPSYMPGVRPTDLAPCLPADVLAAIRAALPAFDRQIKGFAMPDAVLTGVETRTSAPLRIPRGADRQSVNVKGLYPAGEGAGYAGGIMSAAVDGIETAEAVARALLARI